MFKIVYDEKQVSVELSSFESRWRQCDEHWAHTAKHQMEHHSTAQHTTTTTAAAATNHRSLFI